MLVVQPLVSLPPSSVGPLLPYVHASEHLAPRVQFFFQKTCISRISRLALACVSLTPLGVFVNGLRACIEANLAILSD